MKKKYRWLYLIMIIILLMGLIGFILIKIFAPPPPVADDKQPSAAGSDELAGVKIEAPGIDRDSYWNISVDKFFRESSGDGRMRGVKAEYYSGAKLDYKISALAGLIDWETGVIRFEGDVVLQSSDSKEIQAGCLEWDRTGRISAGNGVLFRHRHVVVNAEEVTTGHKFERIVFVGPTRIVYRR